jgi:hypothetical protein
MTGSYEHSNESSDPIKGEEFLNPLFKTPKKLRVLSPQAIYTDRATAACRRS